MSAAEATTQRPPLPPFTRATAIQKVRLVEDAWNSREPEKMVFAYTADSRWRNRAEFLNGRQEVVEFLKRKWAKELDYRLIKELWAFEGSRIAVRFAYEWHDDSGNWFRSYGNENWERSANQGNGAQVSLADRAPSGRSSGTKRSWFLILASKGEIHSARRRS
jgi:nuclear transport factor 2 (NTF2) superfamily protein